MRASRELKQQWACFWVMQAPRIFDEHVVGMEHGRCRLVGHLFEQTDDRATGLQLLERALGGTDEVRRVVPGVDVGQLPRPVVELRVEERGVTVRSRAAVEEVVHARGEIWRRARAPAASEILKIVHDERADLIVAGGYGHSRLGEWIFGGVTHELLAHSPVCCLLSH